MDNATLSALIIILVMFAAGMYIIEPLTRKSSAGLYKDDYTDTPMHSLLAEKDMIYATIKDLDFDYSAGKLSETDYSKLRSQEAGKAAAVLDRIEALEKGEEKEPEKKADSVADTKKCPECGFDTGRSDKFCQSCGAALSGD